MRLLILLPVFVVSCFAIVDIASIDFGEKSEGFSGSVYGSFQKKRGNTHKDEAEYGGRIQYDTNKTITWLQGSVERDEVSGITTDDNAFLHLRHVHQIIDPAWAMEFYFQLKQDKFKNLRQRTLFGTGVRYKIVDSSLYGKLFFGASVMDEKVKYNEIDPDEHNYRMSSYFSYKLSFNKTFELSYLGYYQPEIDNGSDYRTSSIAEMTIHLTKVFDLSYLVEFDYDSVPPLGVATTDTRQRLSFVYRFGQDDPLSAYAQTMLNASENLAEDNNGHTVALEPESKTTDMDKPSETFLGEWTDENAQFSILSEGKGHYAEKDGLYQQKITWKIISADVGQQEQAKTDQKTKVVVISFVDEEGRPGRVENYLWSENTLVGLSQSSVKVFKR